MNDYIFNLLIKAVVLFTAVPVHECAHAWAAHKLGDDTSRDQGRITLNPFRHLSLFGSLMMMLLGFGWGKPVSVDARNFKNPRRDMMLTSLAGPASNFIMAFLAMVVFRVLLIYGYIMGVEGAVWGSAVFYYIALINLSLAVFNFLPIPPLDGSKIFNAILPERIYFKIMQYENLIFIALFVAVRAGLLDKPLAFLNDLAYNIMVFMTNWVENLMVMILQI